MKKYLIGIAGVFCGGRFIAYGKISRLGCERAIFRSVTEQYGQPPAKLKKQVQDNISAVCQQLLK